MLRKLRRAMSVLNTRTMPRRARWDFLTILAGSAGPIRFSGGQVFIRPETQRIDVLQFADVFERDPYRTDYEGALVIDIGAHKGYYGAYAFERGARQVVSYEPEQQNYEALAEAAASWNLPWMVHRAAVTDRDGHVKLAVANDSWSHSLAAERRESTRSETVPAIAIDGLLAQIPDGRTIVKVNAEGSECEIVLRSGLDAWRAVDDVFVEVHTFARCTAEAVAARMEAAGFILVSQDWAGHVNLHFRRPELAPLASHLG